jgi:hypothetical protein
MPFDTGLVALGVWHWAYGAVLMLFDGISAGFDEILTGFDSFLTGFDTF